MGSSADAVDVDIFDPVVSGHAWTAPVNDSLSPL